MENDETGSIKPLADAESLFSRKISSFTMICRKSGCRETNIIIPIGIPYRFPIGPVWAGPIWGSILEWLGDGTWTFCRAIDPGDGTWTL